jgi:hypothetical protein
MATPNTWADEIAQKIRNNFITKVTFSSTDAKGPDRTGFLTFATSYAEALGRPSSGTFDPNKVDWRYNTMYVFFINNTDNQRVTASGIKKEEISLSISSVVIINPDCKMAEFERYYTDAILAIDRLDPAPGPPSSTPGYSINDSDLDTAIQAFIKNPDNETFTGARDAVTTYVKARKWTSGDIQYTDIKFNDDGSEIVKNGTLRASADDIFGEDSEKLLANLSGALPGIASKQTGIDQKIHFELPVSFASLQKRIAAVPLPAMKGGVSVWSNKALLAFVADCNKVKNCAGLVNALGAYTYYDASSSGGDDDILPNALWMELMSAQLYQRAARKVGHVVASMEYRPFPEFQDSDGFLNITSDEMPNALQLKIATLLGIVDAPHRLVSNVILTTASRQISDMIFDWCFGKLYPEQFDASLRATAPYFQRFPVATDDDARRFPLLTWTAAPISKDMPFKPIGSSLIGVAPSQKCDLRTRGYGEVMIEFKFCAAIMPKTQVKLAGNADYVAASKNAEVYARIEWTISDIASTFSVQDDSPAMTLINQATVLFFLRTYQTPGAKLPDAVSTFDNNTEYTAAIKKLVGAVADDNGKMDGDAVQTLIGELLYSNIAQEIEKNLYYTIGDSALNMDIYGALFGINARSPQSIQAYGNGTLTSAAGVTVLGLGAARTMAELKAEARDWWRRP